MGFAVSSRILAKPGQKGWFTTFDSTALEREHRVVDPAVEVLARVVATEVAFIVKKQLAQLANENPQPALLTVKQAAVYLGRSEQAVQHLIFQKELPVVRMGRRVHLDRRDLDAFIEKHKF
jgi:excisionase family DNA binding protein